MSRAKRVAEWVYAYTISHYSPKVIRFTKHKTQFGAEKHYGDLSRHYRGGAGSDYHLAVFRGREEMNRILGEEYEIDWSAQTLTWKGHK